jgi:hypothetical protein
MSNLLHYGCELRKQLCLFRYKHLHRCNTELLADAFGISILQLKLDEPWLNLIFYIFSFIQIDVVGTSVFLPESTSRSHDTGCLRVLEPVLGFCYKDDRKIFCSLLERTSLNTH